MLRILDTKIVYIPVYTIIVKTIEIILYNDITKYTTYIKTSIHIICTS